LNLARTDVGPSNLIEVVGDSAAGGKRNLVTIKLSMHTQDTLDPLSVSYNYKRKTKFATCAL